MKNISDRVAERLKRLYIEWDYTEYLLKQHENILGKASTPAKNELRYAGRRLIDALQVLTNENDEDEALNLLAESIYFSHRAQHDIIDAMIAMISEAYRSAEENFYFEAIDKYFPIMAKTIVELSDIKDAVAESRKNRALRSAIYEDLQQNKIASVLRDFKQFKANEGNIKRYMLKIDKEKQTEISERNRLMQELEKSNNDRDKALEIANQQLKATKTQTNYTRIAIIIAMITGTIALYQFIFPPPQ